MTSLGEQYSDILVRNGIHEAIKEVQVSDSGAKGDGFASVTKRVKVIFEDDTKTPLNLFIKVHTENPSHEELINGMKAFEKEAEFFMEYLPEAKKFCEEKGFPDLLNFYPKCYYGDDQLIVLEDLVHDRGFTMIPHNVKHDFAKATCALGNLAKHHAVAFAMVKRAGGEDPFFKKFPHSEHDSFGAMLPMMENFENPLGTSITILEANPVEGSAEALAMIKSFAEMKYTDIIKGSWEFTKPSEALVLLNHGDYKNNNMMFRMDNETDTILDHVAIDLQVTRYDSPVWDLAFYLFSSVDNTVRQTRINDLLNNYIEKLNQLTEDLGHPANLQFEDLWKQYRKKFKFGFWGSLVMVGPGMEIMKTMDIEQNDLTKMADFWNTALQKWFDDNPDKGVSMAEEIVSLIKEYNVLNL